MLNFEVVHAEPQPGLTFSDCCDRTLAEMSPSDWLTRDPSQVTCGKLTPTDELLLLGAGRTALGEICDQVMIFDLATRVVARCGPSVSLQAAYEQVLVALDELAGGRHECRTAALAAQAVSRATELALRSKPRVRAR